MHVALWIKEKNKETGEWESTFWKSKLMIWKEEEADRKRLRK